MSEAAKKINIDVGDVLKRGSNEVKMTELNKMGLTKVKVIRHSQVQELISQAVENAIARFIFSAEGRKEHERLMTLIKEKESALSDSSAEDEKALRQEVEKLRLQMSEQSLILEQAKSKVIADSKKEYEALAEKTSLENQLVMQKKAELELNRQLQEMTLLVGQVKDKLRQEEDRSKSNSLQLQDLAKIPILEDEIDNLASANEKLLSELEFVKNSLEVEKRNSQMTSASITEKSKLTENLSNRLSQLEEEVRQKEREKTELKEQIREKELATREALEKAERSRSDNTENTLRLQTEKAQIAQKVQLEEETKKKIQEELEATKNSLRDKEFAIRELQAKVVSFAQEKEQLTQNMKLSADGVDAELRRVQDEKKSLQDKLANTENVTLQLKDQIKDRDFSIHSLQTKNELLQSEKANENQRASQWEKQFNDLREKSQEDKLNNEKLAMKEEIAREKAEALKLNISALTTDKERLISDLQKAEEENLELNKQIEVLNQQLTQQANDNQNVAMMEALKNMMADMKGDLSEQINKVKLRAGSGGGGGGGVDNYVELDPNVVLKNMFAEKLESNFGKVSLDSRKGSTKKDLSKALNALKSLKGENKKEE